MQGKSKIVSFVCVYIRLGTDEWTYVKKDRPGDNYETVKIVQLDGHTKFFELWGFSLSCLLRTRQLRI